MSITDRQSDILKIISQLDISPTMYENAENKYKSIARYLEGHQDLQAEMYPQGSFALGTVVRPASKDGDANYDLDFVCQVSGSRDKMTPSEVRKNIEDTLTSSDLYGGKLELYDECITIKYAEVNGIGFSIDIVPAVNENERNKNRLREKSILPQLIDSAIVIPKQDQDDYIWITNNPRGYREWFDQINEPFSNNSRDSYRQVVFEQNQAIYASVEDIPHGLERSALQRVIQILKYHRDVYYSRYKNCAEIKPISAIISTIVAKIAKTASPSYSVFELLQFVLSEFEIYSNYQTLSSESFLQNYGERAVIQKPEGKWKIENPANPDDNLADKWNIDSKIPEKFFLWSKAAKSDLIDALHLDDEGFRASAENAFGSIVVNESWGKKYNKSIPTYVNVSSSPKPWRAI